MRYLPIVLTSLAALASLPAISPGRAAADPPAALEPHAQLKAKTLDALFSQLKTAPDQKAADAIVAKIWGEWMQSGRDDIDVLMSRAVANMAGRHFGLSLLLLDEIVGLAPNFAEGWNKRATLYYHVGQYGQALSDIERALQLEPRHFGALAGRAAIQANKQQWREALQSYRAALAFNPFLQQRSVVLPELERKAGERGL